MMTTVMVIITNKGDLVTHGLELVEGPRFRSLRVESVEEVGAWIFV